MFGSLEPQFFHDSVGVWLAINTERLPAAEVWRPDLIAMMNNSENRITAVIRVLLDVVNTARPAPVVRDVTVDVDRCGVGHGARSHRRVDDGRTGRSASREHHNERQADEALWRAEHLTSHKISDREPGEACHAAEAWMAQTRKRSVAGLLAVRCIAWLGLFAPLGQ